MTGKPSFDLRERPWIPVREGEKRDLIGLRDLFLRAHTLTDVEVPLPPGAAGLWRILYLIAGRVGDLDEPLGVRAFEDRRDDLLDAGRFDENQVEEYFNRFGSRFDLFDETRPWLQDPRLAEQCSAGSGVNKLVFGRPAGSNQVWFSHHTDVDVAPVSAAEAAWHLIGNLYYGPSGRCTTRTVGSLSEANTTAGPLRGSLSCHPVGATVFESIVSGIPRQSSDDGQHISLRAVDEAPWEMAELPDPSAPPPNLTGLSRVLVGRFQHAILLVPYASGETVVDARLTWAYRQKFPPIVDPYLIYQTSKKGDVYARPASLERALWRDLDALLMKEVGEEKRARPAVFNLLPEGLTDDLRVRVYGFDQDGQTRDKQFFEGLTPAVLGWLEGRPDSPAAQISETRAAAEQVGRSLIRALKLAWARQSDPNDGAGAAPRADGPPGPWVGAAEARYWPAAETTFWRLVLSGDFDDPSRHFLRLALDVYDQIAGEVTSQAHWRMIRALAQHRRQIRGFPAAGTRGAA